MKGVGQGNGTGWMDSRDPNFGRVADVWMSLLLKTFGKTGSWYQLDGFFYNGTSWGSSLVGPAKINDACVWSNQLNDTFLAGCDRELGCKPFASLADAQLACSASRTCFGVTAHVGGPYELRGTNAPSTSPSGETSYVIVNAGTCHAPNPDPQWASRGAAAYAPLARADANAVWSFQGYALEVGGGPGTPSDAALARLRGFIDGAPPGHFVIGKVHLVSHTLASHIAV